MAFFSKASNILKQSVTRHMNSEVCGSGSSVFQIIRSMSSPKVFVGGLSYSIDESSMNEAFSKYGEVREARIILDRDTGRSKGFGFVTFADADSATAAIQAMDQTELQGRRIGVSYAQERAPRTGGYGDGGGGYGGGGYRGGGGGYRGGDRGFDANDNFSGGNNFDQDSTIPEGNMGNDDDQYAEKRG